ncbi:hypothetical protein [Propionivibrio sp.]|uniref:hypothetical protein n=1 Tax=Propionivibrio sp. TaxID=2212460 RepID=UPI003BEFAF6C
MNKFEYAKNLAEFLMANTGSVLSTWSGRMPAADQRKLFGRAIGRGRIIIDGYAETIANRVKVCFGADYDDRNVTKWSAL